MSTKICVLAWRAPGGQVVSRGENLHVYEDARLMADELNSEWPDIIHWAEPATEAELAAHASQVARLLASENA